MDGKANIPILNCVLFDVNANRLTLTGTDLEIGGVTGVDGSGDESQWSGAAPVKKLIQYLQKVDEDTVTLSTAENHWLTVKHGTSTTRVAGMSKDSYPELPAPPEPVAVLTRLPLAIERTAFAISCEETRFTLNGALLEVDAAGARLVATDGHRLSLAPLQAKTAAEKIFCLIPKKALLEAGRLDDGPTFAADKDHAFFSWGTRRIIARKLTGNFPDYHRVMPESMDCHANISVKTTLKTLDRVALYADERSHAVRFSVADGKLKIYASSVETGEAEGLVPIHSGEGVEGPFEIGFNASYVSDFLRTTTAQTVALCYAADEPDVEKEDGTVQHGKKGGSKAAVFTTADGWSYVIMPLRI